MRRKQYGPLFQLHSTEAAQRLEQYRQQWEKLNGPTDLSLEYTSQAPQAVQDWLLANQPQLYYDGLPHYVQSFFAELACHLAEQGSADMLPDIFVKLFVTNRGKLSRPCKQKGKS